MPDPAASSETAASSAARSPAEPARRERLGPAYAKLWSAAAVSYLGDGVHNTALPLLAAALTRDPLLIAAVEVAGQLPWLLFALPGGALVDRWDRRRVLWLVDAYRCLVVGTLAVAVVAGWASIPALAVTGFLLAAGGTLFNPASMSVLPAVVSREPARLERANGRLAAAQTMGWHLLGPPLGGVLFSLARSLPFVVDALSFGVSSAVLASISGRFAATRATPAAAGGGMRAQILVGVRWLRGHRLLRTLAVVAAVQQLGIAAWSSIMVLFAQERLGLGNVGFGLLYSGVAVGSLLGSLLATRLSRRLGAATMLRASAVTLAAASLGIGLILNRWAAGSLLGAIGTALASWNVVAVSLRQAVVPDHLQGRVNSIFQQFSLGMLPLGAALGGVLGRALGLRAPFLIGGAAMLAAALLATPVITSRAIDAARLDPK
jgi:MFS family permease